MDSSIAPKTAGSATGLPGDQASLPKPAVLSSLARGAEVLARALRTMPFSPGVYRMLDRHGDALYVGKAKSLRRRVSSYVKTARLPVRLQRMVAQTVSVEVITTNSEVEALLLESNLIKKLKPRYNISLRDDKSFPYILITGDTPWPQVVKYRGAQSRKGEYFGPFASAGAVNQTINALHRAFPLRSCTDSMFESRTRPCLQYQIKRCSAPCVGRISAEAYGEMVGEARAFLSGRSQEIQARLTERMVAASETLAFETAAAYRDRIRAMTLIQSRQGINMAGLGDADVIAVHVEANQACVQAFFFRNNQNFGNRVFFPAHTEEASPADVLQAFVGQFYQTHTPPALILVSERPPEAALIEEALSQSAGARVRLVQPERGDKLKLIEDATRNAREALGRRLAESATQRALLEGLGSALGLAATPARIEIYDNSHVQGTNAVGAMVVAGPEGFIKAAYRTFNIRLSKPDAAEGKITPGDDYGMMREVFTRRFGRLLKEDPERARGAWPDLVLIDGGAGQLAEARAVLQSLGIEHVALAAIAKGPDRNAGLERIFLEGHAPLSLDPKDPVLYFLQRLRDEAHRFAIGTHRARRSKAAKGSTLDEITGIGPTRKRALLHHFGSARAVSQAGIDDLKRVPGISGATATLIHEHFHAARHR
ncbi:MAG: excinuclease ABC subunit UvrC [Alphaproteobacteria bacterium]|nr:excinuclease ABC subunit UvrC [Alphaproteobacteria bacterium]